jgi:hypothetical protein
LALEYLQGEDIAHRDLCLDNLLLNIKIDGLEKRVVVYTTIGKIQSDTHDNLFDQQGRNLA